MPGQSLSNVSKSSKSVRHLHLCRHRYQYFQREQNLKLFDESHLWILTVKILILLTMFGMCGHLGLKGHIRDIFGNWVHTFRKRSILIEELKLVVQ